MEKWINDSASRIADVAGSDPGVYVLALHSFVEGYIRKWYPECNVGVEETGFASLINAFRDGCKEKKGYMEEYPVFGRLKGEHANTNLVRHRFAGLSSEEAVAATKNFLTFCSAAGIDHKQITALGSRLDIWKDKKSGLEGLAELKRLEQSNRLLQSDIEEKATRLAAFEELELASRRHAAERARIEAELAEARRTAKGRKEKMQKLQKEKEELKQRERENAKKLKDFGDAQEYIEYMKRFTAYARTRAEFEKELTRLTPEQEDAVAAIKPDCDFLIRGTAGTGKSLVLLEALRRCLGDMAGELGIEDASGVQLLTFTKTLAQYDAWLSGLMDIPDTGELVSTLDGFFRKLAASCGFDFKFQYFGTEKLFKDADAVPFLSLKELVAEIEEFVFGNGITREEYIDQMIPRKGLKVPLSREQREAVWSYMEGLRSRMDAEGVVSKNYGRLRILEWQEANPDRVKKQWAYLFVDEVQDMNAVGLKVIRNCTSRGVVMAGDLGQSLYGLGSPYARAGLDIRGRSKILKTNFRNTRQIQALAGKISGAEERESVVFREGPQPGLITGAHTEDLRVRLAERVRFYIDRLGYEPENIGILHPGGPMEKPLLRKLEEEGIPACAMKESGFDFESSGQVRVCPLPSAKGLDFPVVFLFLPMMFLKSELAAELQAERLRNLVYVGMTRAMDSLEVFLKDPETVTGEWKGLFGEIAEAFRE